MKPARIYSFNLFRHRFYLRDMKNEANKPLTKVKRKKKIVSIFK